MKALSLISGGLDSCVATAIAKSTGFTPSIALSVSYGQRHARELQSARAIASHYGMEHFVMDVPLAPLIAGSTALTDKSENLPEGRSMEEMGGSIPRSYVPGRNTILLAIAQSIAEARSCDAIFCGFNAVDYSGYPDCRPEFVHRWNHLAEIATKRGVEKHGFHIRAVAPVIDMTKVQVVQRGLALSAPMNLTWSCYLGGEKPCGKCDSCIIRAKAFKEVGVDDPANRG